MPIIAGALLVALLVLPNAPARAEPPATPTPAPAYVPGHVIVQWEAGSDRSEKAGAREGAEVEYQADLGDPDFQLVAVEPGQTVGGAIEELRGDKAVAVAERDAYMAPTAAPNDPLFAQQWALQNTGAGIEGFTGAIAGDDIGALGAWARTVGSPTTVVADIDSGYRFNGPDLEPVAWENPAETAGNGIDDDGNGYADDVHGWDFVGANSEAPSEDADPTDDDLISGGHGVHTAGIIGAAGNNGAGITGVAQNVRIMPLRVCANAPSLNELRCPTSSIIAAIFYAGQNGARVANLSLGGTAKSALELDAFAENPGTLYVIAAGNDGVDNDVTMHYPCDYRPATTGTPGAVENIVCVAATDQADGLASFSDWGAESVDLGAPGTQILSTYPASETEIEDDFGAEDFATKWNATGVDGGFARTNEAPLTSFGITDSPGAAPTAGSVRSSTFATPAAVPTEAGACTLSGRDFVSLGGGTLSLIVFKNGFSEYTFQLPSSAGSGMGSFATVPMTGLAGSNVGLRVRYAAGSAPTAANGAWLDDLAISCYAPLSTPPAYAFLQGTSMAAPQVSGGAALLFSREPAASVEAVSDALISSATPDPALAGKTVSGGRLDVAAALETLEASSLPAPTLTGTSPPSPAPDWYPNIVGSAPAGTAVRIFAGPSCAGLPVGTGTAGELESSGIEVTVNAGVTAVFSATATDGAGNTSPCSAPISFTNTSTIGNSTVTVIKPEIVQIGGVPPPKKAAAPVSSCKVPKVAGETLSRARASLRSSGCAIGKVVRPKGRPPGALVVKASSPGAGSRTSGAVTLRLGPKPKNRHH